MTCIAEAVVSGEGCAVSTTHPFSLQTDLCVLSAVYWRD